ncbi:MAG: fatty acid desaturase, partial [Myxococcota bacterium]
DWATVLLLLAMYALLFGNAVLHARAPLALPIHVLISTVAIHLAFTIWHEAAHGNVFAHRRLNDLVGALGIFPYTPPFFLQKFIHLRHHALLNQPEDPNFIYIDGPLWTIPARYLRALRYAREALGDDPRSPGERRWDGAATMTMVAIYAIAWWQGFLLDLVWLWLLPMILAKLVLDAYINYLPHVGLPPDRFRGTRIVALPWLTPWVLGHNYHAVHHLWPRVPWHRYASVFRERRGYLEEHGVPIQHSLSPEPARGVVREPGTDLPR